VHLAPCSDSSLPYKLAQTRFLVGEREACSLFDCLLKISLDIIVKFSILAGKVHIREPKARFEYFRQLRTLGISCVFPAKSSRVLWKFMTQEWEFSKPVYFDHRAIAAISSIKRQTMAK